MLIVATPNPDSVAETFIRQHIRMVAPGATSVVYFEGEANEIAGLPSLKLPREKNSRIGSMVNLISAGYPGTLTKAQSDQFADFVKQHRAQAVLAEFGQTGCRLWKSCKKAGVPLYVFFHGFDASVGGRSATRRFGYRRMSAYVSKVFVATNFFLEKVVKAGVPREKIDVNSYGLATDEFLPDSQKDPDLILAVGRMVEKKAPLVTVNAFARIANEVPTVRLEMIGDGPLLESVKQESKRLDLEERVILHGSKDQSFVKQKMSKASVFVQHSVTAPNGDTESLGVSLLEAMACEVPVVATRHNGFVETVEDGVTGILVEEYDVEAMANGIRQIITDKSFSAAMGKAGRERVKTRFHAETQASKLREKMGLDSAA